MDLWIFVVVVLLVAVILGIMIGTIIVFLSKRKYDPYDDQQDTAPVLATRWQIELWDIGNGERYRTEFSGGLTLGRGTLNGPNQSFLHIGSDVMLSREQCMIFEQYGRIYVSNLSQVNITYLNGTVLTQPMPLNVGDRLAMGGHSYLVTTLNQTTTLLNAGETLAF